MTIWDILKILFMIGLYIAVLNIDKIVTYVGKKIDGGGPDMG
jgi:hypothetical protein